MKAAAEEDAFDCICKIELLAHRYLNRDGMYHDVFATPTNAFYDEYVVTITSQILWWIVAKHRRERNDNNKYLFHRVRMDGNNLVPRLRWHVS